MIVGQGAKTLIAPFGTPGKIRESDPPAVIVIAEKGYRVRADDIFIGSWIGDQTPLGVEPVLGDFEGCAR
jgi:hypothetical protein